MNFIGRSDDGEGAIVVMPSKWAHILAQFALVVNKASGSLWNTDVRISAEDWDLALGLLSQITDAIGASTEADACGFTITSERTFTVKRKP
jgi:hypothetical protein